jgi:hypothetical protein
MTRLAWAIAVFAAAGCAGARVEVTAARARYPISMSSVVRDGAGTLLAGSAFERVGELVVQKTLVGILYGRVMPIATCDISDDVNAQVGAAGGEAVLGLEVTVSGSCAFLNEVPVVVALPIWPGCVPITITGEIVRRRPAPTPPPPAPPPVQPPSPIEPLAPAAHCPLPRRLSTA